jgi:phenylpropionate dioxygenase-like ring-hydroxylating dioxygenase large terminal subunit
VQENCPHRGASLYFGRNEECGLRCPYHGWKFDVGNWSGHSWVLIGP